MAGHPASVHFEDSAPFLGETTGMEVEEGGAGRSRETSRVGVAAHVPSITVSVRVRAVIVLFMSNICYAGNAVRLHLHVRLSRFGSISLGF